MGEVGFPALLLVSTVCQKNYIQKGIYKKIKVSGFSLAGSSSFIWKICILWMKGHRDQTAKPAILDCWHSPGWRTWQNWQRRARDASKIVTWNQFRHKYLGVKWSSKCLQVSHHVLYSFRPKCHVRTWVILTPSVLNRLASWVTPDYFCCWHPLVMDYMWILGPV